jgi:membrane protease subunit HflC
MKAKSDQLWCVRNVIVVGVGALAIAVLRLSFFAVDASEYAVVTEFGNPVQVVMEPGLGVKYPYQSVTRFDRRLYVYTPPLSEFLTLEKTPVVASTAILWRIADPHKFLQTVFDKLGAEARLSEILFAELGAAIGSAPLTAFVSTETGAYQAEQILETVAEKCRQIAARDYGIEVVDVKLQRLDFPQRTRLSVFARMKSERVRISMKYRSEGEEEGLKIRAVAEQEKTRILSQAFKVAQRHRGEGDAEAARIYAETFSAAPDFYRFLRTREASRRFLDEDTMVVLPADSELFRLLSDSNYYNDRE